jgi:hypothetical protein
MICQQLSAPLAICYELRLVSSVVYFRACSMLLHLYFYNSLMSYTLCNCELSFVIDYFYIHCKDPWNVNK